MLLTILTSAPRSFSLLCWRCCSDAVLLFFGLLSSIKYTRPFGSMTILSGIPLLPGDPNFGAMPPILFTSFTRYLSIVFSNTSMLALLCYAFYRFWLKLHLLHYYIKFPLYVYIRIRHTLLYTTPPNYHFFKINETNVVDVVNLNLFRYYRDKFYYIVM